MKRLLLLPFIAISVAAAPADKPVILKPGKSHEKCMVLDSGQKLEYQFEASAKINFNLHYDKGDSMYYPVKLDRTTGAMLSVASTGMVRTPEGNEVALKPSFSGRAPVPPQ